MRTTIQQLEDLKEWSQDSTRYERRLAFRRGYPTFPMGTEAGTIPIEFDELSDREREYYRTGPWSTREDYRKGQLVQPGPGRQGYQGSKSNKARDLRSQRYIGQVTTQDEKFIKKAEQILKKNVETKNGVKVFRLEKEPKKGIGLIDVVMKEGKLQNYGKVSFLINDIAEKNGWLTPKDYRRYLVVDSFMKDYGLNDQFTGEGKFNKRLKEFWNPKLPDRYKGINKTFKEWAQGDFEVPGFDRSKFNSLLKKNLENWKPVRVNEKAAQTAKELKWLHEINTKHPDWTAKRVQNAFNNKFKNLEYWTDTNFDNRALHLYGILVHGENRTGRATDLSKGDRAPWLKKTLSKNMGGNYQRFLVEADRYEAKGNVQIAKKLRKAAKDLFGSTGELRKAGGHAEHPWFWNYSGVKGMFQIDSLVQGDLNNFKFNNFEGPIQDLIDKYESAGDSLKPGQKKAILAEIDLRRNFLNTMTDIGDGGMARHVTFDSTSTPGRIKVINKTPDIYGVHKAGQLDPLELKTRGGWYRDALIKNLTDRDVNILKKDETIKIGKIGATRMNEIFKAFQANGIGGGCPIKGKAEGGRIGFSEAGIVDDKCMRNAINEHKRKLADGNEAAIKKQMKINQTKGLKNMFTMGRKGLQSIISGVGLNHPGALALEAAIEAAFYGYGRQEGESHEQARENLFFPKIMAKYAPGLWEELGFKPFKTGVWEGPEKLIEEELIGTRWDPSGKVNLAAEYADGMKALEDEYANATKIDFELGMMKNPRKPAAPEDIEAKEQELRDSYDRIEQLQINIKEDTPAYNAYVAAQEKQKALRDERAQDPDVIQPSYSGSKERQWRDEFLDYRGADRKYRKEQPFAFKGGLEDAIVKPGTRIDWDAYADYGWDKPEQKWKDLYDTGGWDLMDKIGIAGGVANMAGGGIAGIRRPWAIPPESGPDPQGIIPRPGYQHGGRQPGLETSTSTAKQEAQQGDIRGIQRAMADRGGGDAQAYVHQHESIPSPIIKKEVQGPKRFEGIGNKKFAYDNLTKFMANEKFTDFKQQNKKVYDTAERILQAFALNEEDYNYALNKVALSGVASEYGVTQEIKKALLDKGINIGSVPLGPIMSGKAETTFGPLTVRAQNVDDKLKAKAELDLTTKGPESTSGIGGLTGKGPSEWKKPSAFDKWTKDITGNITYDDTLAGNVAFDKGIYHTGINLGNFNWDAYLGDEKKKIGVTGMGPYLDEAKATIGPVDFTYGLDDDAWKAELDYPITDNISFKSDYDSDDAWKAGIYGKWTWGPEPDERFRMPPREEPTEFERLLRLNLNKIKTRLNESKGGRVGMGKGGLASLNNYATKRTG